MHKGLAIILVLLFAAACLLLTLLMPLAELGLLNPGTAPAVPSQELTQRLEPLREAVSGFASHLHDDPNFQYYVYALFLGLAMTAAAVAINVVGREEAEEKTILPSKK